MIDLLDCYGATILLTVGMEGIVTQEEGEEKHGWAGIGLVHRLFYAAGKTIRLGWG
jgi:hypothetical protein